MLNTAVSFLFAAEKRVDMSKKPDDQVACPSCSIAVTRRNFSRHCRLVHGAGESAAMGRASFSTTGSRSRSSSRDSRDLGATSSMGGPYDTSTYALMQAATAVLDQHQSFTEAELIEYLADCYPEVPEELRRPLVLGAVAGAQRAAHMYVIVEKNKASPDEQKRGMAANSACALSFWNMGLRTPSRAPSSSRRSSVSISENQPTVLTVNLAELQLPVSMEQSRSDLEQVQSTVLCQGATYEIVAAAPPDAPLVVPIDALAASSSTTTTLVEPYVPPMLPGSSYADMPYVPSATAAQTSQARTDPDSDPEPELSIVAPPDPALFDLQSEMEARKEEEIQVKEEEVQKKREAEPKKKEAESKKTEEGPKKKEATQKETDGESKKKEETKKKKEEAEPRKRREEERDFSAKRKAGNLPTPSTVRRRTSPRRASPKFTSRDESPPRTVSSWEWREFRDYRRRTATSSHPFKKYKK